VRRLVTGTDENGRSCVIEETVLEPDEGRFSIYQTATSPPPPRPLGHGEYLDLRVPPGIARWICIEFEPGYRRSMHYTDSVDFDAIIAGSMDLTLDDGTHHLVPGDCVVMNGVDHAWAAGPDGCTALFVTVGTSPPEQATPT
jgi:quercetin dioxygenase-like cupin family protein